MVELNIMNGTKSQVANSSMESMETTFAFSSIESKTVVNDCKVKTEHFSYACDEPCHYVYEASCDLKIK